MQFHIVRADYGDQRHRQDIPLLLDQYARDPMGGGQALPPAVREGLVDALAGIPGAFSILAYADGQAVGLVNAFAGFSTFACRPLVNIHDVAVLASHRRHGIGRAMLREVETVARERGCCKLTLEVLTGNRGALATYRQFGFDAYALGTETGEAVFWQKPL